MCENVVKSSLKGASVGGAVNGAAPFDVMTSACGMQEIKQSEDKEQAKSTDQEPAVQAVPVQKRPVGGERQRETIVATHMLNSGWWLSESECE